MSLSKRLTLVTATLLIGVTGCGSDGPEIAGVQGVVALDGKPLPNATVMFVPPSGRPSVAITDENGEYRLEFSAGRKGAIPGKNRVEITTYSPAFHNEKGEAISASKELLPIRYNRETTLEFEVVADKKNVADFQLESAGKIATDQESN